MYKNDPNAIQRARKSAGVTQEKLAEMSGYSVESIKVWESESRRASIDVLDILGLCLNAPWLTGLYLRERAGGGALEDIIPTFCPGEGLSQATVRLISRIYAFADCHKDRRLMAISADNAITTDERPEFDQIMAELQDIIQAAVSLRYAERG